MGLEVPRWMLSLGTVGAAVGFTILGRGASYVRPDETLTTLGWTLTVGGIVVTIVGGIAHRAAAS